MTKKKAPSDHMADSSSGEAKVPPALAHDPVLHETAGRPNGAIRGCPACDDNVASGVARYVLPGDRGGIARAPLATEAIPTVEILPGQDDVLAALLKAAEEFKPGMAELLAPVVAYGLEQMAMQGAEDQAFKAWQAHVDSELKALRDDLRQGLSVIHGNVTELIRRLFDEKGRPIIRKVE